RSSGRMSGGSARRMGDARVAPTTPCRYCEKQKTKNEKRTTECLHRPGSARRPTPTGLTFRELEPLACLRTAWLLALDDACVASQEAETAQLWLERLVFLDQSASDREAQRSGLTGQSATIDVGGHVIAAEHIGRREWLLDGRDVRGTREVIAECAAVHEPLARASLDVDAADRFLAATDRVRCSVDRHAYLVVMVSGLGC